MIRAAVCVSLRIPCAVILTAVAPPGLFTCGTDALRICGGKRPARRHGCCARFLSPSAVCTPANDDTRTRSPRCPSPASSRPCTSRTASYGMPRDTADGASSFETAASCICRVVGFIICQMQASGGGNYTTGQQSSGNRCDSSRCTVRSSSARPIYLRDRRAMQWQAPRKPPWMLRPILISERRVHPSK